MPLAFHALKVPGLSMATFKLVNVYIMQMDNMPVIIVIQYGRPVVQRGHGHAFLYLAQVRVGLFFNFKCISCFSVEDHVITKAFAGFGSNVVCVCM
jgi:hypothetical protein